MEEWRKHTPTQRERTLKSLEIAQKQAVWNLQQIEREMRAIRDMNNNNPSTTNRFAVLATVDDDGVDEEEIAREMDELSEEVREDEQRDSTEDEDNVLLIEQEDEELLDEVQEDVQRNPPAQAQGPPSIQHQAAPSVQFTQEDILRAQAEIDYRLDQGIEYPDQPIPPQQGFYQGLPPPNAPPTPPYQRRPRRYQRHRAFSVSPNYRGRKPLPRHVLQQRGHRPFYVSSNYLGSNPKPPHELKRRNHYQQHVPAFYY